VSKLVVNALRCVQTTSGIGSDEVYMVIFRGSFNQPPNVMVIPPNEANSPWESMSNGKLVKEDILVDGIYQAENVYVAALVERDVDNNILENWSTVTNLWANVWTKVKTNEMWEQVAHLAIVLGLGNDDLIGRPKIIPHIYTDGGTGTLVVFKGDGGTYRARFAKRS
jgi:hypothetical protein